MILGFGRIWDPMHSNSSDAMNKSAQLLWRTWTPHGSVQLCMHHLAMGRAKPDGFFRPISLEESTKTISIITCSQAHHVSWTCLVTSAGVVYVVSCTCQFLLANIHSEFPEICQPWDPTCEIPCKDPVFGPCHMLSLNLSTCKSQGWIYRPTSWQMVETKGFFQPQ